MTIQEEHSRMVAALAKNGEVIRRCLDASEAHLWHMATGVCGEAGELIDAIKKAVVYRKPLDVQNVVEELGDLEFYQEGIRQALGITREQVLAANLLKLAQRYGGEYNYTDQKAIDRADKVDPLLPSP